MSLTPGTPFGPYQIIGPLGAGGMGEVYRARDTKLNRDVALKTLPETFALDADRVARFTREAQVLASLNHPNIAALHGIEESGSKRALVMELVEGEDLAQVISRGALSLDEALSIARQIVDALEAAHEQGIVHRDLKPANIKVRADGTVKVLDFGLAKATDPGSGIGDQASGAAANSPTITTPAMTMRGLILGTAAYMSPEQARGRAVDKRADIWAFGAVLYEILTGRRAFRGDEVSETLASVIKDTPDFSALPASTPPRLRALIERCLERDIKGRLRDIGEARILLANRLEPAASPATTGPRGPWVVAAVSMLAAATFVVGTFAGWWSLTRESPQPVVHLAADFGDGLTVLSNVGISPDGQRVAFTGADENGKAYLAIRRLDETTVTRLRPIEGDLPDAWTPFFSPDGQWVAYVSNGELLKVAVTGGPAMRIAGGIVAGHGLGHWGADEILLSAFAGMLRVSIKDGSSIATPFPMAAFLPDGRTMLISGTSVSDPRLIAAVTAGEATPHPVTPLRGTLARYLPIGYLLYIDANEVLQAVAFDMTRMETNGDPTPLMEHVSWFDISNSGTLIFSRTESDPGRTIGWFDEAGRTESIVKEPGMYDAPRLSPDGTRLAFSVFDRGKRSIFVRDLQDSITRPLAQAEANTSYPLWMPGGRDILYRRPGGVSITRADGGGAPRRLIEIDGVPDAISPDGRSLAVNIVGTSTKRDIVRVPLSGGPDAPQAGTPEPLVVGPADEINPVYSPDGRWLAYSSDQSGQYQVYVLAVSDPQSRWQVSSVQGVAFLPRWAPKGQQLFFKGFKGSSPDAPLFVASYSVTGAAFVPGVVKPFGGSVLLLPQGSGPIFDLAPDGRVVGLLSARRAAEAPSRRLFGVVLNVFNEIQRPPTAGAQ